VQFTDISSNGPTSWLWNFGDGSTSALQHPTHQYATDGTYDVKLVTGNSFGLDSLTKTPYITYISPVAPVVYPAARCDSGSVTLTATGSTVYWYDAAAGGNLVNTGGTFVTPVLGATTTYYVESSVSGPSQHVGPLSNAIGTGSISSFPSTRYLKFDVLSPVTLISTLVYSDTAMTRDIFVADASGTIIHDTLMYITAGTQRITLNFDLPTGMNMRIGVNGVSRFFRNQSGAVWPYTLPGLVSITGNSSTQPNSTSYYYFYDWEIGKAGCASERVPVEATILLPNAQVIPNGNLTICSGNDITLTAQTADSYYWLPGGETTQSIIVDAAGTYSVQITQDSCTASSLPIIVTTISNAPQAEFGYVNSDPAVTFSDSSLYGVSYNWIFGDGSTSTVQNPSHTYTANGTYIVTLVVTNACGTDTITHVLDISNVGAGIGEIGNNNSVAVYPNPSNGNFFIDVQTNTDLAVNYHIYDLIGNEVKSGTLTPSSNKARMQIIMSEARGVYLLHIWNETFNLTRKIIIN
jgi:PKD repeat protein